MNGKKKLNRILAIVLASLMILAALVSVIPLFVSAADEGEISYPISGYNPGEDCYEPIPMIVIMINFDADGDGEDDNPDTGDPEQNFVTYQKVKDKNDPAYGEQWCHTTEADWVSRLFSFEGNTLNSYYKYMSDDKFYWIPATETYGEADNGVIAVTIKNVHPNCNGTSGNWLHCFNQIIEAASEYVDFSDFDKNGNGRLEKYELCLAFILGGAETSSGQTGMTEAFGFHAYYKEQDPNNRVTTDGVEVGNSGFFGTGAISGGYPLNFGVFAHELGHYLGAPDLYDTDGTKYDGAVGGASLMASGAHGSKPAHIDPYILADFGFVAPETVREDGTYTLYSKASSEGKYNVIKLATPNPREYYLIENRYSSIRDGSTFDNGIAQGIIVWHIDESIHNSTGNKCNSSKFGKDPSVVAYPVIMKEGNTETVLATYSAFNINERNPYCAVFNPTAYTFPVSGTWNTSLNEDQAKLVENLRVEVVSEAGDEIQIKITGAYKQELLPEISMMVQERTQTSLALRYELDTLNYATMTEAKFILTEKSTNTVVKEETVKFNSDYIYNVVCEGLKAETQYECKIVAQTSHGELVTTSTESTSVIERKYANITMVVNSDEYATISQKVEVGKTHSIRVQLNKYGYTFEGWYFDEEYTQPYTPDVITEEADFTIYAKWEKKAVSTTTKKTTSTTVATTDATSEIPDEPVSGGCGGAAAKGAEPMLLGGAVLAILGAAAGGKKRGRGREE